MTYDFYLNDYIGYYPCTGSAVRDFLAKHEGEEVNVYISSLGGSLGEALTIRQAFIDHGKVTAHVFGFTASAATIIATGAKKTVISSSALFLIHCSSSYITAWDFLNSEALELEIKKLKSTKSLLDGADTVMANIYATKTGKSADECLSLMKEEKWLTASEAVDLGLCDESAEDLQTIPEGIKSLFANRIAALGYPVLPGMGAASPAVNVEEEQKTLIEKITAAITAAFKKNKEGGDTPHTTDPNTQDQMEKKTLTAVAICAALSIEQLTSTNGRVELSEEQALALEKALGDLQASVTADQQKAKDLEAELQNFKNADGEGTAQAGMGTEEVTSTDLRARYEMLKGIL